MDEIWDSHFHSLPEETLIVPRLKGILCTLDADEFNRIIKKRLDRGSGVYLFLGTHPWWADKFDSRTFTAILNERKGDIFGLGEVGLDKHRGPEMSVQLSVLEQVFKLAVEHSLPVNVHCVRAFRELLELMEGVLPPKVIIHSFSGSAFYLEKFLGIPGCFISISPFVLKRPERLRELVSFVPLDRLLIETDYPYQTKDPEDWWRVVGEVSNVLGMSEVEVAAQVRKNLLTILGEDGSTKSA